jgi:hypothetical protein
MHRPATILATAAVALLAAAAPAAAAVDTIGSDLSGTASTAIQRTEDTALSQLSGSGRTEVPTGGQVLALKVKGCAMKGNVPQDPETALFVQDLEGSSGSEKVVSTSQQFHLPICGAGGADQNTVTTFAPQHQCVSKGDLIGIVVGGQTAGYPQGTPYLIAKPSPGAGLGAFSGNGKAVNGSSFTLTPIADTELLVQAVIGTGGDSPDRCGGGGGGGGNKPSGSSLQLPKSVTASGGSATVSATCGLAAGDKCRVSLLATRGKSRVGSISGAVAGGDTANLTLRLNRTGKRLLKKSGSMTVTLRGAIQSSGGRAKVSSKLTVTSG